MLVFLFFFPLFLGLFSLFSFSFLFFSFFFSFLVPTLFSPSLLLLLCSPLVSRPVVTRDQYGRRRSTGRGGCVMGLVRERRDKCAKDGLGGGDCLELQGPSGRS